jgi:uroporphyrinogen decarboxylase
VERIEAIASVIIEQGRKSAGHIFNLGHGILPPTEVSHARALVEAVHRLGTR